MSPNLAVMLSFLQETGVLHWGIMWELVRTRTANNVGMKLPYGQQKSSFYSTFSTSIKTFQP